MPGAIDCNDARVQPNCYVVGRALRPRYAGDASWRADGVHWPQRVLQTPQRKKSLALQSDVFAAMPYSQDAWCCLHAEHMHQPLAERVCLFPLKRCKLSFSSAATAREPMLPKYKDCLDYDASNITIINNFVCAMAHLTPSHTSHAVLLDCSLRPVP